MLWLTPAMDRLFTEAASPATLSDRPCSRHPATPCTQPATTRAMRARNKLLAEEVAPEARSPRADEMATGAATYARGATVSALAARLEAAPAGPFARAGLALSGGDGPDLARSLAAGRSRDASAGRTLAGPHRTDLVVSHLEKSQPAALSSTGEQKALLIGIVLAHADLVAERAGRRPILLLDEIAAHLDPVRRAALFERLDLAAGQVWMTGTERSLFAEVAEATWLAVADGAVASAA